MKNHKILMLGSTVMVLLAIAVAPVQAQFELRLGGISLEQVGPPPPKINLLPPPVGWGRYSAPAIHVRSDP